MTYTYTINDKSFSITPDTPNQKIIKICKVDEKDGINFDDNEAAQVALSGKAYRVYMYFMRHQHNFVWKLFQDHTTKITGLSKSTYHEAIRELEQKGFLVYHPIKFNNATLTENSYYFFEKAQEVSKPTVNKQTPATPEKSSCTPIQKMPWEMTQRELATYCFGRY